MMYAHIILLSDKGYRPLSHRIEIKDVADYKQHKEEYRTMAIRNICFSRRMDMNYLRKYGYSQIAVKFENTEKPCPPPNKNI